MDLASKSQTQRDRTQSSVERAYSFRSLDEYSFKDRFLIRAADLAMFVLISVIGCTLRWEIKGAENLAAAWTNGSIPIYTFWHDRIFFGTYFFRKRSIVIMTSQSFDGEYIARFIQRFGYGAVRGSSTRGGVGAIVEMVRLMRAGCPAGFSIDGPKGPRYVAKMGAVLLAKKTGNPILPFTITSDKRWTLNSWDRLQIPLPFTRTLVDIAPGITVPSDANEETMDAKRNELQQVLNVLVARGEDWRKNPEATFSNL
jgi:lysophospholipid acyltransferase (LPLAT)-like uncharacterized protein